MLRLARIVASWLGGFRPPQGAVPDLGDGPQALLAHVHQWGACKWNGQMWYARCVAYEWCPARIAC